jgi:hypothetical protein
LLQKAIKKAFRISPRNALSSNKLTTPDGYRDN